MKRIRACPIFELVTPPSFALTVFRLVPGVAANTKDRECVNALNRAFYDDLQARPNIIALTHMLIGSVLCPFRRWLRQA